MEIQVKENNIIQLLRKREFNFNDKTSIIGELLGHSKDLLYAVSLFSLRLLWILWHYVSN